MPKIDWRSKDEGIWHAARRDQIIGAVVQRDDGSVAYRLDAVVTKWITTGNGEVRSVKAGKAAVQRAWDEWCFAMGLVDG